MRGLHIAEVTNTRRGHMELGSLMAVGTTGSLNNRVQLRNLSIRNNVGTINHKNGIVAARVRGFSKVPIIPTLN